MDRRSLFFRAAGLAAAVGGAWWARDHLLWPAPQLAFGPHGATPWLPYARQANVPTVRLTVAGREVTALIDSGAQYSVIDRALLVDLPGAGRSMFDMPMLAYGVGGGAQLGRGTRLDVRLPGLEIKALQAAVLDLGPLAAADGLATPLILGQDVLEQLVLALDPDRKFVRLIARPAFVRPPDLHDAPVRRASGGLVTEVRVEGATVDGLIDTGAGSFLGLSRDVAGVAGLLDGRPHETGVSLVLGGALRSQIFQARTVTFAGQLSRGVSVGVFDQPPLPQFPGGLIGMAAFDGRRAALDLGAGTLHVSRTLDLTVGQSAVKVSQAAGSPVS